MFAAPESPRTSEPRFVTILEDYVELHRANYGHLHGCRAASICVPPGGPGRKAAIRELLRSSRSSREDGDHHPFRLTRTVSGGASGWFTRPALQIKVARGSRRCRPRCDRPCQCALHVRANYLQFST